MATATSEKVDKYDVLEKIGKSLDIVLATSTCLIISRTWLLRDHPQG